MFCWIDKTIYLPKSKDGPMQRLKSADNNCWTFLFLHQSEKVTASFPFYPLLGNTPFSFNLRSFYTCNKVLTPTVPLSYRNFESTFSNNKGDVI